METRVMMMLYVENNEGPRTVYSSSGSYHQSPERQYRTHVSSDGFVTIVCVCVWSALNKSVLGHVFCPYLGTAFKKKLLVGCDPIIS